VGSNPGRRFPRFLILVVTAGAAWAVEPGKPSVTSIQVAVSRAIGARHPDPAVRNRDYLAEKFVGPEERAILAERGPDRLKAFDMQDSERAWEFLAQRGVLPPVLHHHTRTRYIDEVLEKALAAGTKQIVILGAGFDSRAYRFAKELRGAKVFEVDFPPTQEYKKKRVREVLGSIPPQVVFVPIDFTKEKLGVVLRKAGYRATKRSLFIWEGVTYYLPPEAVDDTLQFVAKHSARGSVLVFDYFFASFLSNPDPDFRRLRESLAKIGEPFIFGFPDGKLDEFLSRRGLKLVEDLDNVEENRRYARRSNGTVVSERPAPSRICQAVTP
jgi:methyltransferase (TIGR00027 family)